MASRLTSLLIIVALGQAANAQVDPALYGGLKWREIGPFRGGRSNAVHGVPGRPDEFYMGTCGGGLWKSTNGGVDWACTSDGFFKTGSVGAIGVSASSPDTVYVGMGETELRGNVSHGDGVYKSTDAGKTWTNVGLKETRHIARVRVHPQDPNTVWVAALGHAYGPNKERGVYKTTDGGATWRRVLYVSDRAGAVDICIDPNDPQVLFASMWEAWRTPYSLSSGGPGSGLYKSTDGGETWTDVSSNPGMPVGTLGKIGVAVSAVDSSRVYAMIEAKDGGLFVSDDGGGTWSLVNEDRNYRQRAFYYTRVYADPKEKDTVYVMNVGFGKSTDGGKKFSGVSVPHSDNHDLWINPDDPKVMINANDGGGNVTKDGGKTWTNQDFATAQFYHVTTDNAFPYRIYGAQQDNSTVRIASRAPGGIDSNSWESTAGGESGYVAVKPDDPEIVVGANYSGSTEIRDHRTGLSRDVNPWPDNPIGRGAGDLTVRMQWTFPMFFSPHDDDVLYVGSQYVLKSTDLGGTWKRVSPDLTRNDPATLQPSGGPITKDNTGVEVYATVFTLAESPLKKGLIWAGSDDGLVHVTRDGGKSWRNVTPQGMPERGLCSMIEASPHRPSTAFLALDNHENDDFRPYVYVTEDYGKTWRLAVSGIDGGAFVRVVREDPTVPGLLYAGTETGAYVSFDFGTNWVPLLAGLPVVPIHDLTIKNGDLIAATHGRSFWVLDDLSPLRQAASLKKANDIVLFRPSDASRASFGGGFRRRRGATGGEREPVGANPLSGVVVDYYLPSEAKEVALEFFDKSGTSVARQSPDKTVGAHRVSLTPQYPGYKNPKGVIMWDAFPAPIKAPPGAYTVRLTVDGKSFEQNFRWSGDPRSGATDAELIAQFDLSVKIQSRLNEANRILEECRSILRQLDAVADKQTVGLDALKSSVTEVRDAIYQEQAKSGQDLLNYPVKLNNRLATLLGFVQQSEFGPPKQAYEVFTMLDGLLTQQEGAYSKIVGDQLSAMNARLKEQNLPPIDPKQKEAEEEKKKVGG